MTYVLADQRGEWVVHCEACGHDLCVPLLSRDHADELQRAHDKTHAVDEGGRLL
jgi:hypothetical protein